ncbi:MAG: MFS transporter [Solirubrobacterales bacterium]
MIGVSGMVVSLFALGLAFKGIEALGRFGAFWFYGAIGILTLIFCWKLVPETKGKRLEDIQAYLQARVDQREASA